MSAPREVRPLAVVIIDPISGATLEEFVRKHPAVAAVVRVLGQDGTASGGFNVAIVDPFQSKPGFRTVERIRASRPRARVCLFASRQHLQEMPGVPETLREWLAGVPRVEREQDWPEIGQQLMKVLDRFAAELAPAAEPKPPSEDPSPAVQSESEAEEPRPAARKKSRARAKAAPPPEEVSQQAEPLSGPAVEPSVPRDVGDVPQEQSQEPSGRPVHEAAAELGIPLDDLVKRLRALGVETDPSSPFPEEHRERLRRELVLEDGFARLTRPESTPPADWGEFLRLLPFSDSARLGIGGALGLAMLREDVSPPVLDSVLLLAGLVHQAHGSDTRTFLAAYLHGHAAPERASGSTRQLLDLGARHGIPPTAHVLAVVLSPRSALPGPDFWAVVQTARRFARETLARPGKQVEPAISARHLIAALLAPDPPLEAHRHLERLGYDLDDLRENLLERLRELRPDAEDVTAWERILLPRGAAPPRFLDSPPAARYAADTTEKQTDQLDITREVNALSAVLASEHLAPPLAVGLFGDWGTGKSFFMGRMDERIRELKGTPGYCSEIVQIWFNAWHYMDANLWASLVSEIFERLAEQIREGTEDPRVVRERLLARLAEDHTLLHEAERQKVAAEEATERATERLQELRSRRGQLRAALRESPRVLRVALAEPGNAKELGTLARDVGLPETVVLDLRAGAEKLTGRMARLRATLRALTGRSFGAKVVFALALLALPLVAWGVPALVARFGEEERAWLAGVVSTAALASAQFLAWVRPLWRKVGAVLPRIQEIYAQTGKVADRYEARAAELQRKAEQEIARLDEQETAARRSHTEAAERVQRLEEEIEELRAGRRLHRFLMERSEAQDYRSQQGIIATVRRDFDRLATLLKESRQDDEGKTLRKVDRIVLYIDDLDRCPEERVVEVLQAVHLLLAFPLFVVVVGVDSRWLLRSLEKQYVGILAPTEDGAREAEARDEDRVANPWESTPHHYLEKIFQIPFTLRPMDEAGFGRLVRSLVSPPEGDGKKEHDGRKEEAGGQESAESRAETADRTAGREAATPGAGTPRETPAPPAGESRPDTTHGTSGEQKAADVSGEGDGKKEEAPAVSSDSGEKAAAALKIGDEELKFIERLGPLIHSPRAAKRFVNIYRFIRVGLDEREARRFHGVGDETGEYRVVALLLAILTGFPAEAADLLREIRSGDPEAPAEWWPRVDAVLAEHTAADSPPEERARWEQLGQALGRARARLEPLPRDLTPYRRWSHHVGRFSFHTGHVLTRLRA